MTENFINYINIVNSHIEEIVETLAKIDVKQISDVINILEKTLLSEGNIYILGNGGSASTASHIQNDFNCAVFGSLKKRFRFYCLSDNIATITAIANDFSYADIYFKQLENKLLPQDLIVAISGSGNSKNVIKAVEYAKLQGNKIIGMTGYDGGKLYKLSDFHLHVNVRNMQIVEDIHLILGHLMGVIFREKFKDSKILRNYINGL